MMLLPRNNGTERPAERLVDAAVAARVVRAAAGHHMCLFVSSLVCTVHSDSACNIRNFASEAGAGAHVS